MQDSGRARGRKNKMLCRICSDVCLYLVKAIEANRAVKLQCMRPLCFTERQQAELQYRRL